MRLLLVVCLVAVGAVAPAQVINNWTNPLSGRWDSASSWSLGALPAPSQSVTITNDGYKAVDIDSATFTGFPDSLTVSNLSVAAPTNGLSTLLLNYTGLTTPLKVLNACAIGTNGTLDNESSSFEIDGNSGGQLHIDGGNFIQQGGLTVVNAPVLVQNGSLNATNGDLTLGDVTLGTNATLHLLAGSLYASNIVMHSDSAWGMYNNCSNEISGGLVMEGDSNVTFIMWGGTLESPSVGVGLNARFLQNSGQNFVHGVLSITGSYELTGGNLVTEGLYLSGLLSLELPRSDTNLLGTMTNQGLLDLGGTLSTQLPDAWLGQVALFTNGTIDFTGSPAQLHFAPSSNITWSQGALLVVNHWTNSGGTHLYFGTDASGLTASQLVQIQFVNPGGFAAGTYPAQLLSTGELVPGQGSPASVNSWVKSTDGDWQDQTAWSLGVPPAPGQTIVITNPGSKDVVIGSATTQNFPGSLDISSVVLGGGPDSFNTLLLSNAGFQVPLTSGSIEIGTNSSVILLGSSINVSTNLGTGALTNESSLGQDQDSVVTANSLQVGSMQAAGVYNLTNGTLAARQAVIGEIAPAPRDTGIASPFNSSTFFNQTGGSVALGFLTLYGGTYNISGGAVNAVAVQVARGVFQQIGGSVTGPVGVHTGTYLLSAGVLQQQSLTLPSPALYTGTGSDATFLQTGGTNYCEGIGVWNFYGSPASPDIGPGHFVLSNGVLCVSNITRSWPGGDFEQWGGLHTNGGTVVVGESVPPFSSSHNAGFELGGGTLLTPSIEISYGAFTQSGGTNLVARDVTLDIYSATYTLSGGLLGESNASVVTSGYGYTPLQAAFSQSGGTQIVTNQLRVSGGGEIQFAGTSSYDLGGGQLTVGALDLAGAGTFSHRGGTFVIGGLLTLGGGTWNEATTGQQFGPLLLDASTNSTNSTLQFPSGPCQVRFADSSSLAWNPQARLFIVGWNGAPGGGGQHQLVFGSSSAALTPEQLGLIWFRNPSGTTNTSPARILPTGELVPGTHSLALQETSSGLILSWGAGTLQNATNVAGPYQGVPSATSPYTISPIGPQEFFRLGP